MIPMHFPMWHKGDDEGESFLMPGTDDWTVGCSKEEIQMMLDTNSIAPPISKWKISADKELLVSMDKARANCEKQAEEVCFPAFKAHRLGHY